MDLATVRELGCHFNNGFWYIRTDELMSKQKLRDGEERDHEDVWERNIWMNSSFNVLGMNTK